jgi:hypothetical protein
MARFCGSNQSVDAFDVIRGAPERFRFNRCLIEIELK